MTLLEESAGPSGGPSDDPAGRSPTPEVDFDTDPEHYRHWRYEIDGPTAWVYLDVAEDGGIAPGYELKLNSYDLGVDIELHDLTQRLRFCHPEVRSVVLTSGRDANFCAGANIRMLAAASHPWKVNFCKFTNETRNGLEDMTEHGGQTWIAALNGTAAGGGYEMALACDRILLVDDRSSAVSLPEVPLRGVLPGTGGLTRVIDKRRVRKDRADVFATRPEGFGGRKAVDWKLVDEAVARRDWDATVRARAAEAADASSRDPDAVGIAWPPLERTVTDDALRYDHVRAEIDRGARTATVTVTLPAGVPDDAAGLHELGAAHPVLALARELDDLILRLRTNELTIGTWLVRTEGPVDAALAADRLLAVEGDWLVDETRRFLTRVLKRLDVTSRSLIALIEPGSCFAGPLLELALACDRQYMLEGVFEDADDADEQAPATLVVTAANLGAHPMGNGLSRLASRFYGDEDALAALRERLGEPLTGADAEEAGLVTDAPDDIDWDDEIRILVEERASLSPDALTGMEANHRFVGPETMETRIFGRLTAWQNWIFIRPNASGPEGALRKYGTGRKADFDRTRV